jgi:hypothetical protein
MALDLIFGKTRRDWSCGSILLPAKQQRAIFDKLDDVRYDVRRAGRAAGAGILCLAAAIGLVAVSNLYKASRERR